MTAFDAHPLFRTTLVQSGSGIIGSAVGTSLVITASGDFPDPASGLYNIVVCPAATVPTVANAEVMRCTAKTGTTVTVARAQEGTAALAVIAAGYQAFIAVTPKSVTDIETAVNALTTAVVPDSANKRYVTDAELVVIINTSGVNTGDQTISDATITTTDITTNDVSTSKHGFAPKAPNDGLKYLDGTGAFSIPFPVGLTVQAGDVTIPANYGAVIVDEYVMNATDELIFSDPSEMVVI